MLTYNGTNYVPSDQGRTIHLGGDGSNDGVSISDGAIQMRTGTGNPAYIDMYCEVSNAHKVTIKAPAHATYSGNVNFTLPPNNGSSGQFLRTDGSGNLSYATVDLTALSASNLTSGTIPDARFPATLPAVSGANLTGIISDLVEDTTPQLGGNLDMNSNNITGTGNIDVTGSIEGTSFTLDNGSNDWTVTVSGNNLIFSYAGTGKMKLDTSGNLTVTGDIISEGTI